MRHNPKHAVTDEAVVRQLIAENPWATIVSQHAGELVASHYPVLLDEESEQLAIVTHVGRPDEQVHGFADREVLLIVAGPHGYVSPSWYSPGSVTHSRAGRRRSAAPHDPRSRAPARRAGRRA